MKNENVNKLRDACIEAINAEYPAEEYPELRAIKTRRAKTGRRTVAALLCAVFTVSFIAGCATGATVTDKKWSEKTSEPSSEAAVSSGAVDEPDPLAPLMTAEECIAAYGSDCDTDTVKDGYEYYLGLALVLLPANERAYGGTSRTLLKRSLEDGHVEAACRREGCKHGEDENCPFRALAGAEFEKIYFLVTDEWIYFQYSDPAGKEEPKTYLYRYSEETDVCEKITEQPADECGKLLTLHKGELYFLRVIEPLDNTADTDAYLDRYDPETDRMIELFCCGQTMKQYIMGHYNSTNEPYFIGIDESDRVWVNNYHRNGKFGEIDDFTLDLVYYDLKTGQKTVVLDEYLLGGQPAYNGIVHGCYTFTSDALLLHYYDAVTGTDQVIDSYVGQDFYVVGNTVFYTPYQEETDKKTALYGFCGGHRLTAGIIREYHLDTGESIDHAIDPDLSVFDSDSLYYRGRFYFSGCCLYDSKKHTVKKRYQSVAVELESGRWEEWKQ